MSYYTASGRKLIRTLAAGTTALTFLAGHNFAAPPGGGGGGGGGGPLTVTNFTRDKIVYDDGSAVGLSSAAVPVFGTGPVGATIEGRAVSQDDSGVTTTAWAVIGTVSGAGTYAGALTVPYSGSWYKVETRLQATPATTAATGYTFAVGSVFAIWGQSESARGWDTGFNDVAIPALVTVKQQVLNLANPGMCGRTSRATLKVAGVDALPAGATISGNIISLNGSGTLTDWYFEDYQLEPKSGSNWDIDQCYFRAVAPSISFFVYVRINGVCTIKNCTAQGTADFAGLAAAFREEDSTGSGHGLMYLHRCHIYDISADGFKLVAGRADWCHVKARQNIANLSAWSGAATYNTGDRVYSTDGWAFSSKIDGNTNPLPATKTSDANWLLLDPHTDLITIEKAFRRVRVAFCLLDMSEMIPANGGIGANNNIRIQPNSTGGFLDEVDIVHNVCLRDSSVQSFPFQVTTSFLSAVNFSGNWLTPFNTSTWIYSVTASQTVTWQGNVKASDDTAISPPTNCTSIAFTAKTTDDEVQHIFNDRLPSHGSGSVQHKFMTAASRYTVAFAAMANTCLMETPGRKVVWLHHSVSGTGFTELFNDGNTARMWSDEAAIHAYATVDGGSVGLALSSWYASPAALALNYGIAVYELFAKKHWTTNADLTAPFSYPSTLPGSTANHFWGDLYSAAQTRWCLMGPHQRMAGEGMQNSIKTTAAAIQFTMKNYARCRQGVRNAIADARTVGYLTAQGIEPMNWETGYLSNPSIIDWLHPAADTLDGLASYLAFQAHGALQAAGIRKWVVPEFDQVFWAADGSYVEVWSAAGDVTTTRKQRGLADIGTTHPHWTDCFAWEWCTGVPDWFDGNGLTPIESAIIVAADGSGTPASAGRVRIAKPGGGTWASGDTVAFGGGGGSGHLVHPDDGNARAWMNLPIVLVGAYGADGNQVGMSLRPMAEFTRP